MNNPSHEAAAPAPGYLYQSKWPLVELVARSRRQPDIEVPLETTSTEIISPVRRSAEFIPRCTPAAPVVNAVGGVR